MKGFGEPRMLSIAAATVAAIVAACFAAQAAVLGTPDRAELIVFELSPASFDMTALGQR